MQNLADLRIYKLSCEIWDMIRDIYKNMNWEYKKNIWDQIIRSSDSIAANIAEWCWRYHYMDSIRFYYNSRWSLYETKHRIDLLFKRQLITQELYNDINSKLSELIIKLNSFIEQTKKLNKK